MTDSRGEHDAHHTSCCLEGTSNGCPELALTSRLTASMVADNAWRQAGLEVPSEQVFRSLV